MLGNQARPRRGNPQPVSRQQKDTNCSPLTRSGSHVLSARLISQAFKVGFPIRTSKDQSLFAAPLSLSQRITSFFACACQGIHQLPLIHLIVLIAYAHHPV